MPHDLFNPFQYLGGVAGKVVADAWTSAMLGLWNGGLWILRVVLHLVDALTTPDLSEHGPGRSISATTFWLAGVLVVAMLMVQLGMAAIRRDGRSLATAALGAGKFVVVWAGWIGYGVTVVAACGGLTRAVMRTVLTVTSWSTWQPWASFSVADITDGTVATVLGLMGLLLWLAAIGHLLVMITRAGALIVLAAMTPAAAAGLVSDAGRTWFWKSLRWFHAAAFTPVLMVLMLGVGVQMTTGVANGLHDTTQQAIGTALPGVILILVACFSPLALFKLLAFVDPTTGSGAAARAGYDAAGGLRGLMGGRTDDTGTGSRPGGEGQTDGEATADDATVARFTKAQTDLLSRVGGAAGAAVAGGIGVMAGVGAAATAIGSDLTNQMGVGHHSYHPEFRRPAGGRGSGADRDPGDPDFPSQSSPSDPGTLDTDAISDPFDASGPQAPARPAAPPPGGTPLSGTGSAPGGAPVGGAGGSAAGSGETAAGAAEAAAAVPIIPV